MKIIIFAGGTGKRFWPASTKQSPKQFQEVIDNKPLIKLKYDYLRLGFKAEDIFVSTGIQYKVEVENILSDLPKQNFIYEPAMRGTGPAVLFASEYIFKKFGDEIISLQWADHYIKKPKVFVDLLLQGEKIVEKTKKSIVVGVPIRFPSTGLGHIKNGNLLKSLDKQGNIKLTNFLKFVEKPTLDVAKEYIKSGDYTWNTGYFITYPSIVRSKYKEFAPNDFKIIEEIVNSNYNEDKLKNFETLEKKSFDYIFAENLNENEALVLIANMGWSDVGEWISLKEALEKNKNAVVKKGFVEDLNCKDSLIYNYDDTKLVSVIDLQGIIVVNTKNTVAIFPKEKNAKLKEYLKMLEEKGLSKYL